jgi:hypothetical protein
MYLGIFNSKKTIEINSFEMDGLKNKVVIHPYQSYFEKPISLDDRKKYSIGYCLVELEIEESNEVREIPIVNKKIALCFNEILKLEEELDHIIQTELTFNKRYYSSVEEMVKVINTNNKKEISKINLIVIFRYLARFVLPFFSIFYLLGLIHICDKEIQFSRFHLLNEILTYFTFFFVLWSLLSLFGRSFTNKKLEALEEYLGFNNRHSK